MGSSVVWDEDMWRRIENELVHAGNNLLSLPESNNEILVLLWKTESILVRVYQQPPKSTGNALFPAKQALITDKLMRNGDLNIRIAVASCLNEVIRISAPDVPYNDDKMKEIFQLYMTVLKHLGKKSQTSHYIRAWRILDNLSTLKSCVILLDIDDSDRMVVEMFHLFFDIIKSNNSPDVVNRIEMLMTTMIEESDNISVGLLKPLIDSVKLDNKKTSPISWTLGKTVIERGASVIQLAFREAVEALNIKIDDYAEIVASLCKDTSSGENMVAEVAATVEPVTDGLSCDGLSSEKILQLKGDHIANSGVEAVDGAEILQSESDAGVAHRSRRVWKPNTKRAGEGYQLAWIGPYSLHASHDGNKKEKVSDSPLEHRKENMETGSSHKESDPVHGGSHGRRAQSKMKEVAESSNPGKVNHPSTVKKRDSKSSNRTGKEWGNDGSSTLGVEKAEEIPTESNLVGEDELLLQYLSRKKGFTGKIISAEHKLRDPMNKMVDSRDTSPGKAKNPGNSKKRGSDAPRTTKKRRVIAESNTVGIEKGDSVDKGKGIQIDTHIEENDELLLLELSIGKETGSKLTSETQDLEGVTNKSMEAPAITPAKVSSPRNVKWRGSNDLKPTCKKKVTAKSITVIVEKGKCVCIDTDSGETLGPLPNELSGKKDIGDEIIFDKHEASDVANKFVESPTGNPAKAKGPRTVNKRGPSAPKKADKRGFVAGPSNDSVGKGEQNPNDTDSEMKNELLGQELSWKKQIGDKIISKKHELSDVANKFVESPTSKPAKAKGPRTVKKRGPNAPKNTDNRVFVAGSSTVSVGKTEQNPNDNDSAKKDEFLGQELSTRRSVEVKITSKKHETNNVANKMVGTPMTKPAKAKRSVNVKKRGPKAPNMTNKKRDLAGSCTVKVEKVDGILSDTDTDKNAGIVPQGHESRDAGTKMVESSINNPVIAECSSNKKDRGRDASKKTDKKRVVAGSSTVNAGRRDRISGDTHSEKKDKLILQESSGRKGKGNRNTSQKHEARHVAEKKVESSMTNPVEAKFPRNSQEPKKKVESSMANPVEAKFPRNSQEPKKNESSLDYGEELVNTRIKVWWPMDKTFYTGTVASYDSLTKKHMIKYDDDEEEILNLNNERWEPFTFGHQQAQMFQRQEADLGAPALEPVHSQKKTAKRKGGASKKLPGASSSKRAKNESCSSVVMAQDSAPKDDDTDDDEMHEAYFLKENACGSHAGKVA